MRSCPEYALLVFQGKATKPREEQVVVRIVNEAARDQAGRGDAGGSRVPNVRRVCRVKETSRAKSIRRNEEQQDYDGVEQHSSVQDLGAQAQSKQRTNVSDGINKERESQRNERLPRIRNWDGGCHGHTPEREFKHRDGDC